MKNFRCRDFVLTDDKRYIMGILNVTPDSFSDGGDFFDSTSAVACFRKMKRCGVDIIDIGACSTRPGSERVDPKTEIERLKMVFDNVGTCEIGLVSVDTYNAETAEFVLENGASIINDVSGRFNPDMADLVKKYSCGLICTHAGGGDAGDDGAYENGVEKSVTDFFEKILDESENFGISRDHICLDPGFGFSKNTDENISLLKNLEKIIVGDVFFLTALSRKRFVGVLSGQSEPKMRDEMSHKLEEYAFKKGSNIVRTHDFEYYENRTI